MVNKVWATFEWTAAGLALSVTLLAATEAPGSPAPFQTQAARGPLRVDPTNPRSFTDGRGRAILLNGSRTWGNLQEPVIDRPPAAGSC